jgi:hypothetical protein
VVRYLVIKCSIFQLGYVVVAPIGIMLLPPHRLWNPYQFQSPDERHNNLEHRSNRWILWSSLSRGALHWLEKAAPNSRTGINRRYYQLFLLLMQEAPALLSTVLYMRDLVCGNPSIMRDFGLSNIISTTDNWTSQCKSRQSGTSHIYVCM